MENASIETNDIPEVNREKLARDLRVLIRDAEALLKDGATEAGGRLEDLKTRLQASLSQMKETYQRIEEKAVAGAKVTDKTIREHPYESIGVAFGIGLLIGVLVTRK
ncbi:MAG TPA: DUF883 family protein [Verrucomicrobiae bacterium]|nr:DUF883 family protein [Verrucomicrobiae bacterium]